MILEKVPHPVHLSRIIHQGLEVPLVVIEYLLVESGHPTEISRQKVLGQITGHQGDPILRTPKDCHKNHM
jgi:hypothetical protein